ncbi:MAG: hypothetical protein IZT57_00750, partial [Chloroflexi bacterium]|nr:hypothetical protein [Chloroflexota bacterium]
IGMQKLQTNGSASAINVSGVDGGTVITLGYHDGESVVPYTTPDPVVVGSQIKLEHGVGVDVYLITTGGTGINLNIVLGRLNQYM